MSSSAWITTGIPAKDSQSQWDAYQGAYGSVTSPIYERAEGIFLKGDEPGWGDWITASRLQAVKLLYSTDSKEWKYGEAWDDSRWTKLIKDRLEPYAYKTLAGDRPHFNGRLRT